MWAVLKQTQQSSESAGRGNSQVSCWLTFLENPPQKLTSKTHLKNSPGKPTSKTFLENSPRKLTSKTQLKNSTRKLTSKISLKAIRPCHFPPSPSRVSFPSRGRVWLASAASNGSVLFPTPGSSLHELIYLERGRWTSPWLSDQSSAGLQQSSPTSLSSESPLSLQRCCCRTKPSQVRTSPDLSALVNPSSQEFEPRSRSKSRPQRILYFAIKD